MTTSSHNTVLDRRAFMKMAVAGTAVAAAGCSPAPRNKLLPYLIPPESLVPGVALWYKSTCRECPAGCGLLVRTREGRALKVEGNPDHPINRGKLCIRGQASLQGLYNPDRLQQPLRRDEHGRFVAATWEEAEALLANLISYLRYQKQADRITLWSEAVSGSLDALFTGFLAALGSTRYQIYEPFAYEPIRAANQIAFGVGEIPRYDLAAAQVLLSFGSDFLETWVSNTRFAADFAEFRRIKNGSMGQFIHIEPRQSLTAANADEWISPKPGTEVFIALGMVREILRANRAGHPNAGERSRIAAAVERYDPPTAGEITDVPPETIVSLAKQFAAAEPGLALGGGIAVQGSNATQTLLAINLLNYVCGNIGRTIFFGEKSPLDKAATMKELQATQERMSRGLVPLMFFHHVNPAHSMPASTGFVEAMMKVPYKVSFSNFMDETAAQCDLVLPDLDPLERWEDYSPGAGVHGIVQPTMESLFQAKATPDVFLSLAQRVGDDVSKKFPQPHFRQFMEERWKSLHREMGVKEDFAAWFRSAIESGGVWRPEEFTPVKFNDRALSEPLAPTRFDGDGEFYLMAYPSLHFFDGRGANRPWLQETPDPLTKLVWDSWIEIHPESARRLGIQESDVLNVTSPAGDLQAPAHLTPGIRPDTLAIPIGQGHRQSGRYAKNRGVNVLDLLSAQTEPLSGGRLWTSTMVRIEKLAVHRPLVGTQGSDSQQGRGLAQAVALTALIPSGHEPAPQRDETDALNMYAVHEHPEHRWGLVIDLNACIGCNACVAACYAENNIAIVGKEQVRRGRHMAWIRIERYFEPRGQSAAVRFLPMMCQQCDNAPCESVCPVYATYHNNEGLNAQVYNRCVGTRYCSNNCPYHVRRFNWFDYDFPYPLTVQLNPDLTVRSKGVMEKCTFCVQRIRAAKDQAKDEGRAVRDGEIVPACAQTCPTNAIVFGDLMDANSLASRLARDQRRYHALGELNTRPGVTYLQKIRLEE